MSYFQPKRSISLQEGDLTQLPWFCRMESQPSYVLFKPCLAQRVEGKIHLSVVDNQCEETSIQIVGEGYQDDITLDNIHGLVAETHKENAEGQLEEDRVEGKKH